MAREGKELEINMLDIIIILTEEKF